MPTVQYMEVIPRFHSVKVVVEHLWVYATKQKSNELMAHTYSHLFNIPTTGLRFLPSMDRKTRYGIVFVTDAIINNKPLKDFNNGNMIRDFTFIDDIIESLIKWQ